MSGELVANIVWLLAVFFGGAIAGWNLAFLRAESADAAENREDECLAIGVGATEPPPDRWVAVNARGLARALIQSRLAAGDAYDLVANLPDTVPPAAILFPDEPAAGSA